MPETNFQKQTAELHDDNTKKQAAMDELRQEYPFNEDIFALNPDELQVFKENMGELNRQLDEENQRIRALLEKVRKITGTKEGAHNQETVPKVTIANDTRVIT